MVALNNKKKSKICLKDKEKDSFDDYEKEREESEKAFEKEQEESLKAFEKANKRGIEEANKRFEEYGDYGDTDEDDVVVKGLHDEEEELDDEDELLTFGQKIHMAQGPMKKIFQSTIIAIILVGVATALIFPVSLSMTSFIDSKGHDEYRLDSRSGPVCNPQLYDNSETFPAQILINDDSPAYDSGLRNGDIITKVNDVQINNKDELLNFGNKLGIVPGEIVRVSVIHLDGDVEQLDITTSPDPEQSDMARLGVGVSTEFSCMAYFFLNDDVNITGADLDLIKADFELVMLIIGGIAGVIAIGAIFWIPKIKELREGLEDWEAEYLDESYSLAFETDKFTERIDGEILFNLSQEIFPELRKKSGRLENWAGKISPDNYGFDCFQPTNQEVPELFVAKNFDDNEINFESIKEICEQIKKAKKDNELRKDIDRLKDMEVFRVICIGKKYDEKIIKDDDYLEEIKDKISPGYPIDFIIERDGKCEIVQFEY